MTTTGGRIVVVGLGPAGPDLITAGTQAEIDRIPVRFVRTTRHPASSAVSNATSFDHLYEAADTIGEVYVGIVDALVAAAKVHGEVLYAVPGSPSVAEHTVELLRQPEVDVDVEIHAALSFLDLAWVRMGVDPLDAGVQVVDGHAFAVEAAGAKGPLLVAQCDSRQVLSDIKLSVDDGPTTPVTVIKGLGTADEEMFTVAWDDLDRSFEPDHLTSLYIPEMARPAAAAFAAFDEQVRILRVQCPWDAEQTHASLRRHLLEETYEVLEALDGIDGDPDAGYVLLEEELGDLLYQIFFHSVIAAENGWFTVADVAQGIYDKLERRHPHVFGELGLYGAPDESENRQSSEQVLANWEQIKRSEKGRTSVMDGVPLALPALALAAKVLSKAADFDLVALADGATNELGISDVAYGTELLAIVARARQEGVDAESALRSMAMYLVRAVRAVETSSGIAGTEIPPA